MRGLAYLTLNDSAAAEKEFAAFRSAALPLVGDYVPGKILNIERLWAASTASRSQEVISAWPQIGSEWLRVYALAAGRAYLETGAPAAAERHLRLFLEDTFRTVMRIRAPILSSLSRIVAH